jgi:hypothetical protein
MEAKRDLSPGVSFSIGVRGALFSVAVRSCASRRRALSAAPFCTSSCRLRWRLCSNSRSSSGDPLTTPQPRHSPHNSSATADRSSFRLTSRRTLPEPLQVGHVLGTGFLPSGILPQSPGSQSRRPRPDAYREARLGQISCGDPRDRRPQSQCRRSPRTIQLMNWPAALRALQQPEGFLARETASLSSALQAEAGATGEATRHP